jgi:hypothetical protein
MSRKQKYLSFALFVLGMTEACLASDLLSPYLKVADLNGSIPEAVAKVKSALVGRGFEIIGEYSPEKNDALYVVAYSRPDLRNISVGAADRGALASVLKAGFVRKNGVVAVSLLNPSYLFHAYLGKYADAHAAELKIVADDAASAVGPLGGGLVPFGGAIPADSLKRYHYMAAMPRFSDPVLLKRFGSFSEGVETIRKNLLAGKGNTVKVFEATFPDQKVAVFGVGLLDKEKGERRFLPIIGEDHAAALPYEIILQNDRATILHGKYRFALHWPQLTMGTFMKILSAPGDVERFLKSLTD